VTPMPGFAPLRVCDTPETVLRPPLRMPNQRYYALMKNLQFVSPLFTSLLFGSMAAAQARNLPAPEAPQPQESASAETQITTAPDAAKPGEDKLIAQARRYPRLADRPVGSRRGMYSPGFPPPPPLSPIGVLIGFGAGAAIGASNPADGTVKGHIALGLIGGTIGAFIGGAIAAANPFLHTRRPYRPSWPDDDEEVALPSHSRGSHSESSASATSDTPSPPTRLAVTAQPSGKPAVAAAFSGEFGEPGTPTSPSRISQ
jgi:hypothetical protein